MSEAAAEALRDKAVSLSPQCPDDAIKMLTEAISRYPQTWTVMNLMLDDLIRLASEHARWDDAIWACRQAQTLKPESKRAYIVQEKACALRKSGKYLQALEVELAYEQKRGGYHTSLQYYANELAKLNANDRAWQVYNEAVVSALGEQVSPHVIQRDMAKLLLKENKPEQAVELLIDAIAHAERLSKKGSPQALTADLRGALKAAGLPDSDLAEEIVKDCKRMGSERVKHLFRTRLQLRG